MLIRLKSCEQLFQCRNKGGFYTEMCTSILGVLTQSGILEIYMDFRVHNDTMNAINEYNTIGIFIIT